MAQTFQKYYKTASFIKNIFNNGRVITTCICGDIPVHIYKVQSASQDNGHICHHKYLSFMKMAYFMS
jgi:hypothetical protein